MNVIKAEFIKQHLSNCVLNIIITYFYYIDEFKPNKVCC